MRITEVKIASVCNLKHDLRSVGNSINYLFGRYETTHRILNLTFNITLRGRN